MGFLGLFIVYSFTAQTTQMHLAVLHIAYLADVAMYFGSFFKVEAHSVQEPS